jgi:hypothetical protein
MRHGGTLDSNYLDYECTCESSVFSAAQIASIRRRTGLDTVVHILDSHEALRARLETAEAENVELTLMLGAVKAENRKAHQDYCNIWKKHFASKYRGLVKEAIIHRAGCGICLLCITLDAIASDDADTS